MIAQITVTSPDGFYNYDCSVEGKLIAKIEYDRPEGDIDCETQPWTVRVNDQCLTRFSTYAGAESYIRWHYKQKTLPQWTESQQSEPELEPSEHPIKCVLRKQQYALIEGNYYPYGFETKIIPIAVSYQTENAVMAMLHSLGLDDWDLVDCWEVQEFALEPCF